MLEKKFHSYFVRLRSPDGLESTARIPLARGIQLGSFAYGLSNITTVSASPIEMQMSSGGFTLSFPADLKKVNLDDSEIYRKSSNLNHDRVQISGESKKISHCEFEFENNSVLSVEIAPSTFKDLKDWFSPFSLWSKVIGFHLILFSLMFLHFPRENPRKISVNLVDVQSRLLTKSASSPDPTYRELKTALNKFTVPSLKKEIPKPSFSRASSSRISSKPPIIEKIQFTTRENKAVPLLNVTAEEVNAAIDKVSFQLKECYDDVLVKDPALQGRPQIMIQVAKAGTVEDLKIHSTQGKPQTLNDLSQCFRSVFQKVKFPAANQDFAVTQTLVLTR